MEIDVKSVEILGEALASGAASHLLKIALVGMGVVFAINMVIKVSGIDTDDTDKSRFKRSGLRLHTDYKTGVQYVSDGNGGLHVRIDRDGKTVTYKGE